MNTLKVFALAASKKFVSEIECIDYRSLPDSDTLALLYAIQIQKWLRDKHKIFVEVQRFVTSQEFMPRIKQGYIDNPLSTCYQSYEEALIAGINEALKLI